MDAVVSTGITERDRQRADDAVHVPDGFVTRREHHVVVEQDDEVGIRGERPMLAALATPTL
jgi:hypothetical protein